MSTTSSAPLYEWTDQLKLAKELVQRDDEAALRTVIYLAYYAIYNSVVAHLLNHGAPLEKTNHRANWGLLNQGKGSKPKLVRRGNYLRDLRNVASYELDYPEGADLKADAQKAIQIAETMLAELG